MSIACLTITSIAFGSLFVTPQLLFAQGEANETFFEAAIREAGPTEQQNQTEAAPPSPQPSPTEQQNQTEAALPSPQPSPTEQQNQSQSQNPFEQLGQAISRLFGGN